MTQWYDRLLSHTKMHVWLDDKKTTGHPGTFYSNLKYDKVDTRKGIDALVRLYLRGNWRVAVIYDNRTGQTLRKYVDKKLTENYL